MCDYHVALLNIVENPPVIPKHKKCQHPSRFTEEETKKGKFQALLDDPQPQTRIKEKSSKNSRVQAPPKDLQRHASEPVKKSKVPPKQTKHMEGKDSNTSDVQAPNGPSV